MQSRMVELCCRLLDWHLWDYEQTNMLDSGWIKVELPVDFLHLAIDLVGIPNVPEERDWLYEKVHGQLTGVIHGGWDRPKTVAKCFELIAKARMDYAKRHPTQAIIEACDTIDLELETTDFQKHAGEIFRDMRMESGKAWKPGELKRLKDWVGRFVLGASLVALVAARKLLPFWDTEQNTARFVDREKSK